MSRAGCLLVIVAGCDLGIGSDPNAVTNACAPGHTRSDPAMACLAPRAAISIDGDRSDWADLTSFPVGTGMRVTIASNLDGDSDLLVRVSFANAPAAETGLGIALSPSRARPGSGGSDRITEAAGVEAYVKGGFMVAPDTAQAELARVDDGFEARILHTWLTYQGAARLAIITGDVVSEPFDGCWGFGTGVDALPSSACEASP